MFSDTTEYSSYITLWILERITNWFISWVYMLSKGKKKFEFLQCWNEMCMKDVERNSRFLASEYEVNFLSVLWLFCRQVGLSFLIYSLGCTIKSF